MRKPKPAKNVLQKAQMPAIQADKFQKTDFWMVLKDYLLCILGGVIYALALNLFLRPLGIYIANLTGVAQILQDLLKMAFPGLKDILGLLVILLNLPLFILSFASINRGFFLKTLLTVFATSAAIQFIPVKMLITGITEPITYVVIGAVIAGFGVGLSLRSKGSSGGVDILGVYLSLKRKGFSIGRVTMIIAAVVYIYAFFQIFVVLSDRKPVVVINRHADAFIRQETLNIDQRRHPDMRVRHFNTRAPFHPLQFPHFRENSSKLFLGQPCRFK